MIAKLVAPLVLATCLASPALAQSDPLPHGPALLLHGNYCGPGNNAPLPPIDALDAACARHDACTPDGALASKACNLRLQREADLISHDPRQPDDLRALAGLVAVGASILPSDARAPVVPVTVTAPGRHGWHQPAHYRPALDQNEPVEMNEAGED
jgi:hypothetical protein